MKKLIIGVLICVLGIGLMSCSKKEDEGSKQNAKAESFTREELSFGIKDFEVKGELITPNNGKKPYKVAVIVGGSGPTNRDASIQSYHPYKDIAEGLAEKGIASFRYDKRAVSHKDKLNNENILDFTIKEEYLDDYNEVIKYLSERKDIDKNNVFTIGHSQGGYIIPMLEKTNNLPKGYVFLAAPSTKIEDAMIEQCEKILKTPNLSEDMKKQYTEMKSGAEKVKTLTTLSPNEMIAGASVKYWLDLKSYNVLDEVKNINKPMIFLQGLNDFNVPERDLNLYKDALKGKENVEYKTYKDLTHLFTKGASTTVETEVIDDIAKFINK